jgi:hypothetical protein
MSGPRPLQSQSREDVAQTVSRRSVIAGTSAQTQVNLMGLWVYKVAVGKAFL